MSRRAPAALAWLLMSVSACEPDFTGLERDLNCLGAGSFNVQVPGCNAPSTSGTGQPRAGSVRIVPDSATLQPGQTLRLSVQYAYVTGAWSTPTWSYVWSTADTAVVRVDAEGDVTAVGPGTATIVATAFLHLDATATVFVVGSSGE